MVSVRVASWNLNFRGRPISAAIGAFLGQAQVDLVMLQEANPRTLEIVCESAGLDWGLTAFDAGAWRPPSSGRGSGRHRVAAIAGRGTQPVGAGIIPDLRLPERMVYASVPTVAGTINVASYHAPPGVSWGKVKVDHAHALLQWITATPDPVIVGADANTPELDHPDPALLRTHWQTGQQRLQGDVGDDVTFGGTSREHRLEDAYRRWLSHHPDQLAEIARAHPSGPLAISHRTGKRQGVPGTPRRFDALWVSPHFTVHDVGYDYDGAITAGSDHALVTADLSLPWA